MSAPTVEPEQLAPLARGRGDGITRLARRTQRGQGRRRLLVGALIAVSVLLGAGAGVLAETLQRSDATVGLQDRFGDAEAVVTGLGTRDGFGSPVGTTVADLTADQRAWLADRAPVPASQEGGDPFAAIPTEVLQALGFEPVRVDVEAVLDGLDLPADDVLLFSTSGMYSYFWDDDQALVADLDPTHPLAGTTFDAGDRTVPLRGDEALLSPSLLARTGLAVGDVDELAGVGRVEVVGTATRALRRSQEVVLVAPGRTLTTPVVEQVVRFATEEQGERWTATVQASGDEVVRGLPEPTDEQLAILGVSEEDVAFTQPYVEGAFVERRADWARINEQSIGALVSGTVASLATVVAAIVGACAFAVGVRRRIREIGMLGAIGATPRQLGRLLRREGLLIGLGGALVGAGLAVVLSVVALPLAERIVDRDLQLVLTPAVIALPAAVGAVGTLLAAAWPARTAARVPVVTALAGRVPLGHVATWVPVAGAVAAVAGVALLADVATSTSTSTGADALQLLAAVLLATLGTATLGLPVLDLGGRLADRLPLLGRLALRDAARQRTRSAAAVAALVPVLALPVAGGAIYATEFGSGFDGPGYSVDGVELQQLPYRDPGPSDLALVDGPYVDGVRRQVPPSAAFVSDVLELLNGTAVAADVVRLGAPDLPDTASVVLPYLPDGTIDVAAADESVAGPFGGAWGTTVTLATPELLAALGLAPDAVPADGALLFAAADGGTLPAEVTQLPVVQFDPTVSSDTGVPPLTVLGRVELARDTSVTGRVGLGVLVDPAAADRLGLIEAGRSTLLQLDGVPTRAEAFDVEQLNGFGTGPERGYVQLSPAVPFWQTPRGIALGIALGMLAAVLGISVVAGMTSALAATESDEDVRKAVALGASPSLRWRLHGLQAWWHTVISATLGSGLGLAVAWAFLRAQQAAVTVSDLDGGSDVLLPAVTLDVPWLAVTAWVVLVPVLVGLVIAAAMRPAPVGAPLRRTA
jgi:putative ABC transport system permease protein